MSGTQRDDAEYQRRETVKQVVLAVVIYVVMLAVIVASHLIGKGL